MKRLLIITCLLLLLSSIMALTLDEARQMALGRNSRYRAQLYSTESARWGKQQALGNLLPSLTAKGSWVYMDPAVTIPISTGMPGAPTSISLNHDMRSMEIDFSQPLFLGGRAWNAYQISRLSEDLAKLSLESTRQSIVSEVDNKYFSALQTQDVLHISEMDLQSSQQSEEIARIRYEGGTLSQADYLKVQSRRASKEVTLLQANTAVELAKQDLMNTLDTTEIDSLADVDMSEQQELIDRLANWQAQDIDSFNRLTVKMAERYNLGFQSASVATKLSHRAYKIANAGFLPSVVLSASRVWEENGKDRYQFSETSNTVVLAVSLPLLPFWNTYAATKKAKYDLLKSKEDLHTARSGITLSARAAALNLISAAKQIKAADIALQYSLQTYDQMRERYRNGLLSTTDMLDVEVMLYSARMSVTNARYGFLKAETNLRLILGQDDIQQLFADNE